MNPSRLGIPVVLMVLARTGCSIGKKTEEVPCDGKVEGKVTINGNSFFSTMFMRFSG